MSAPGQGGATLSRLRADLAGRGALPDAGALSAGVRATAAHGDRPIGLRGLLELERRARAELLGAGEALQALLEDRSVTDVLVNGAAGVWVDRGDGVEVVDVDIGDEAEVRALAVRLSAACGQRLDDACPVVDGSLPDGTRLHAVLPPLSASGTLISLRTLRTRAFTLAELTASGTVAPDLAPVLLALVRSRANVLVSGATGTGKTTLLASMLSLVGPRERIVCIEEATELRPDHPHVVHLQVRRANVQAAGGVAMAELVRAAMRMRPDRLVLGECRGPEVREVLGALNTGHDGGWATVHANASGDVPARLMALGALAGMGERAVAVQAVSALDAVLHLRRDGGRRRLVEVAVLSRRRGELGCDLALRLLPGGQLAEGPGWPRLAARLDASLGEARAP